MHSHCLLHLRGWHGRLGEDSFWELVPKMPWMPSVSMPPVSLLTPFTIV